MSGVCKTLLTYLGLIAFIVAFEAYIQWTPFIAPERDTLTTFQQMQLNTFIEMTQLVTTLATFVVAGASTVYFQRYKNQSVLGAQRVRLGLTYVLAAVSIYLGYISMRSTIWMLDNRFFDLSVAFVQWPSRLQWVFLILSTFLLLDFMRESLKPADCRRDP